MDVAQIVCTIIGVTLPVALVAIVIVRLRQRRLFVHFRLIDEKTQQPLAGAEVFLIRAHQSQAYVMQHSATDAFSGGANAMVHGGQQGAEKLTKLGTLDQTGAFRGVFSAGSGGLTVRASGITAGLIGMESVANYGAHPAEPYVCVVRMGMIAPPIKQSAASLGLGPGAVEERASGFMESYERPVLHEAGICWPTAEEAKAGSMSGGMSRLWKVRGAKRGPGIGGSSFLLAVEHIDE